MKYIVLHIIIFIALCMAIASCSVNNYIPEEKSMLMGIEVSCENKDVMKHYLLGDYVNQKPNTKWFGIKIPLNIYMFSGTDTTTKRCKFFRRIGQAPVLYDSTKTAKTREDITKVLNNAGYMKATTEEWHKNKGKKKWVRINVNPNERYTIRKLSRIVEDKGLRHFITVEDTASSLLKEGSPFDVNALNNERNRIASYLRNNGYFMFNKEDIRFTADTSFNSTEVDVAMKLKLHQKDGRTEAKDHKQYTLRNIIFHADIPSTNDRVDTTAIGNYIFLSNGQMHFRKNLLISNSLMKPGNLYNDDMMKRTYTNFTRLPAISYTSINMEEEGGDDSLDCHITINHALPHSFGFDVEATNSAGDMGAALSTSYQNKNLFRGSETFMFKIRGAYEAITGLDGYEGNNYTELGAEASLGFPSFLLPYVKRTWGILHNASSEINLQYNMQNRPEFHRRVFTAAWRYKWSSKNQRTQHKFDLAEINYVYMPWISKTFKEQYLDSLGKTNAILKYNYENLLITKMGYTYTYNSLGAREQTYGKNAYTIRFNIETSGNILKAMTSMIDGKKNEYGQYTFCGIAYAQYIRGDFDFSKSIRIGNNSSVAYHGALGIACPYGNSNQLPFEKRYFAGGANSVRGWSVRSLGPGSYNGQDKGINFLNQSGDIKLDLCLEYRAKLFWKFNGAAFIDAGNIWTIRKYKDQLGGEFRLNKFLDQIAVSYGLGLRMDANFFIVRFDAGMKAVNPAYTGKKHLPVLHPNFDRDFAFHFAVGLPF